MARDPRTFLTVDCGPTQADQIAANTKKRNFFSALGKIGDIELLNEVNAGKIGEGLRTLASISDSIRDGKPGSSGLAGVGAAAGGVLDKVNSSAEAATNAVLSTVGINATAAQVARDFNPGVVNRAVGQAEAIADSVRQGNFGVGDIPSVFQDIQNLDILLGGIYTPDEERAQKTICEPSPYAVDLVNRQPKFKFLFVVEFKVNPELIGNDQLQRTDIAFVVHQTTRPTIEFEYEDINMYNLRTRVAKRTMYTPMTMRFYDDDYNQAFDFYTKYLRFMSPIANISSTSRPAFEELGAGARSSSYDEFGRFLNSTSSLGALAGDTAKSILDEIRLYHLFNWGQSVNIYQFYNPRITSLELDELNMAESGPTEVSFQFAYDGVHIIPYGRFIPGATNPDLTSPDRGVDVGRKSEGTVGAFYPLHFTGDARKEPFSTFRSPETAAIPALAQTTIAQPSGAAAPSEDTQTQLNLNTPVTFEQPDGTIVTRSRARIQGDLTTQRQRQTTLTAAAAAGDTTTTITYPNGKQVTADIQKELSQTSYQISVYETALEEGRVSRNTLRQLQVAHNQPVV